MIQTTTRDIIAESISNSIPEGTDLLILDFDWI